MNSLDRIMNYVTVPSSQSSVNFVSAKPLLYQPQINPFIILININSLIPINIAITRVPDSVSVSVLLRSVPYPGTVVTRVSHTVVVNVLLSRVVTSCTVVHLIWYTCVREICVGVIKYFCGLNKNLGYDDFVKDEPKSWLRIK